jgi:hypothetical protein
MNDMSLAIWMNVPEMTVTVLALARSAPPFRQIERQAPPAGSAPQPHR